VFQTSGLHLLSHSIMIILWINDRFLKTVVKL